MNNAKYLDNFSIMIEKPLSDYDRKTLNNLYLPIVHGKVLNLFYYFHDFVIPGEHESLVSTFEKLTRTLEIELDKLCEQISVLEAIGLVKTYYLDGLYVFYLKDVLTPSKFFQNELLYQALISSVTKEDAEQALTYLTAENFEEKALSLGQEKESTYFGMTQKNQLSEALQEPVFKAGKGHITQPIETSLGWQVFYIKDIKEAVKADENMVKAEIKKTLINNKAYDKLAEISRQLEDLLGEGKSLQEAAASLSLETKELPLLDVAGTDKNGTINTMVTPALMQEVFTLKQGEISSLIEHNNGYLIGEVVEIDPVGAKPFNEVKGDVEKLFTSEKQKENFEKVVEALTNKAKNGTPLSALEKAPEGSFKLEKVTALTRTTATPLLQPHLKQIFTQESGLKKATFVLAPNNQGAVILVVDSIQKPDFNQFQIDLTSTKTSEMQFSAAALDEAVFNDYLTKLKFKVNQKAINQIISLYKNQE